MELIDVWLVFSVVVSYKNNEKRKGPYAVDQSTEDCTANYTALFVILSLLLLTIGEGSNDFYGRNIGSWNLPKCCVRH